MRPSFTALRLEHHICREAYCDSLPGWVPESAYLPVVQAGLST